MRGRYPVPVRADNVLRRAYNLHCGPHSMPRIGADDLPGAGYVVLSISGRSHNMPRRRGHCYRMPPESYVLPGKAHSLPGKAHILLDNGGICRYRVQRDDALPG